MTNSTSKGSSANLKDKQREEPRSQQILESTTFNTSSAWKKSTIFIGQTDHAKVAKHPSWRLGERKSCIHIDIHPKKNQIQRTKARRYPMKEVQPEATTRERKIHSLTKSTLLKLLMLTTLATSRPWLQMHITLICLH